MCRLTGVSYRVVSVVKGKGRSADNKTEAGSSRSSKYASSCCVVLGYDQVIVRNRNLQWPEICEVMKAIDDIGCPEHFYDELLQHSYENLPKLR